MVDFYGFHVAKYTSPMDTMGNDLFSCETWQTWQSKAEARPSISNVFFFMQKRWMIWTQYVWGVGDTANDSNINLRF